MHNEIRAVYNNSFIRIYQAYNNEIADSAIKNGKFVCPPFKKERMTWIKPSFLWMMYRCNWGEKDKNQQRILAIDITIEGFEWALSHACLSHFAPHIHATENEWKQQLEKSHVRIQWDPERDLFSNALNYRSIQVGLKQKAVEKYLTEWIANITDITNNVKKMKILLNENNLDELKKIIPKENKYHIDNQKYYFINL